MCFTLCIVLHVLPDSRSTETKQRNVKGIRDLLVHLLEFPSSFEKSTKTMASSLLQTRTSGNEPYAYRQGETLSLNESWSMQPTGGGDAEGGLEASVSSVVAAVEERLYEVPVEVIVLLSICYGAISLVAVVGNTFVLWIVATSRRMRTETNYLIANLAISDIIIGLFSIPFHFQAALLQRWLLPHFMCAFCPFVQEIFQQIRSFLPSWGSSSSVFVCPDQDDGLLLKHVVLPDTEYLVRWRYYESFVNDVRHRLGSPTTTPDQELRRNDHRLLERAGGAAKPCSAGISTANLIVASTPDETLALTLCEVTTIQLGATTLELTPYLKPLPGTTRGVITGLDVGTTNEQLQHILATNGPRILHARLLGTSTAAVITFEGTRVPYYINTMGHRQDIYPNPEIIICPTCHLRDPPIGHPCTLDLPTLWTQPPYGEPNARTSQGPAPANSWPSLDETTPPTR
ncbi:hypothetical protein HPB48_016959 [Haemaphysalis longicornis]|uniref:G-protein coupled receptors family 1 profile domain-containing protein n=1 Tax=Haemaphysalis longicornis TaxID=44386 RepID=A0A9J6FCW3_HAELO|nr:hypothetical protein HPB48_016959 [Haemaphysalis longicornis]